MSITIKVTPKTKQVLIDVTKLEGTHKRGLRNALHEIGAEVVKETYKILTTGPRTGKFYNLGWTLHQASANGEPPASRTGKLARSCNYKVRNHQEMTVGETADYAKLLEEGTKKLKGKREHLIKAVNNTVGSAHNAILDSVKREISK